MNFILVGNANDIINKQSEHLYFLLFSLHLLTFLRVFGVAKADLILDIDIFFILCYNVDNLIRHTAPFTFIYIWRGQRGENYG